MSTTTKLSLKLRYENFDTRTYSIDRKTTQTSEAMKAAIRNFNTAAQTAGSSVKQTFISNDGSPVMGIETATEITRTEEVIYGG